MANTEETYWNYALAVRSIDIFQKSVDLARQQLSDAQERVNVGKLAASELAAAQAELSQRQEDLINARSDMEKTRIKLLRYVNPQGVDQLGRQVTLLDEPTMAEQKLGPVEDHIKLAMTHAAGPQPGAPAGAARGPGHRPDRQRPAAQAQRLHPARQVGLRQ